MTKKNNKNNSVAIVIFSLLQLLSIIGAGLVYYFTQHKMGMMRHVMFKNRQFSTIFTKQIITLIIIFLSLIIILDIIAMLKIRFEMRVLKIISVLLLCFSIYLMVKHSETTILSFYYIMIFSLIFASLECLILLSLFLKNKKNKNK